MASVASEFIEEVTAYAQSDSLEDAREICADATYFPNNLLVYIYKYIYIYIYKVLVSWLSDRITVGLFLCSTICQIAAIHENNFMKQSTGTHASVGNAEPYVADTVY